MKIAFSKTRRSWTSQHLVAVAIGGGCVCMSRHRLLLGNGTTLRNPHPVPRPRPGEAAAPVSTLAGIAKIRVGKHPDFTRVVLELTGSYEWTIEQPPGAPVRILIPGVGVDASIRRLEFSSGVVRSVQTTRRANGVEVVLVCQPAGVKVRTLTLTDPERLVVDVSLPGPGEEGRALAQAGALPPGSAAKVAVPGAFRGAPARRIQRVPRSRLWGRRIERRVSRHPRAPPERRRRGEAERAHRRCRSGTVRGSY